SPGRPEMSNGGFSSNRLFAPRNTWYESPGDQVTCMSTYVAAGTLIEPAGTSNVEARNVLSRSADEMYVVCTVAPNLPMLYPRLKYARSSESPTSPASGSLSSPGSGIW